MPNPTGTTYLSANQSYTWADGDVYKILQTDEVEGASSGASFSNLGVDNQPHQVLLNKIELLHKNLLADEATLAEIAAQQFTSSAGVNGWISIGSDDVNLGLIRPILQWGTISLLPYAATPPPPSFTFNFPITFPNAVWLLAAALQASNVGSKFLNGVTLTPILPLNRQGNGLLWLVPSAASGTGFQGIYNSAAKSPSGYTNIAWIALGY